MKSNLDTAYPGAKTKAPETFEKIKPKIKKDVDRLFDLFQNNLELFPLIMDKCKNVGKYDSDTKKNITFNTIKRYVMDSIGNTPENAKLIIDATTPIYNITEIIQGYNSHVRDFSLKYIGDYSLELLGASLEQ